MPATIPLERGTQNVLTVGKQLTTIIHSSGQALNTSHPQGLLSQSTKIKQGQVDYACYTSKSRLGTFTVKV